MCGRFTLRTPVLEVARLFGAEGAPAAWPPRFNIAPTQAVLVLRRVPGSAGPRLDPARWGLVPRWARDASRAAKMINARAETVAELPAFREAFRLRRCVVPADGFYEWRHGGGREPFYFRAEDGRPLALAGIWERWQPATGEAVESCAIITTGADERVLAVHGRMPVILPAEALSPWMDPATPPARVLGLLRADSRRVLVSYPVDPRVGNVRSDDASLVEPLGGG